MGLKEDLGYRDRAPEPVPLSEYLKKWADTPEYNANTAGRIVRAIGKPKVIETSKDPRLGRIFSNRTIYTYDCFKDLYGIEEPLHSIVKFLEFAAEGLEQSKQILYLLGPVGSGKSTIVETLKRLAQTQPVWVLGYRHEDKKEPEVSPVFESPLSLFDRDTFGVKLEDKYGIPARRLRAPMSRWAAEKFEECDGDFDRFVAIRRMPSIATRTCIARVEPGDEKTMDVGALIGRADSKGGFGEYQYTGGLNRTTQGVMEFFEMFKATPPLLYPLLAATQDHKYAGAGDVGELPFEGLIIAHSNQMEWDSFKGKSENVALVDRICPVQIPYCVRITEEAQLYQKYLDNSEFKGIPCTPEVLRLAARFAVVTRVQDDNRDKRLKLYDGQSDKTHPGQKDESADELRASGSWSEGMSGVPTRFMLKMLPEVARNDAEETGLDMVSLINVLRRQAVRERLPSYNSRTPEKIISDDLEPECKRIANLAIQRAYYDNYAEYATQRFNLYFDYADAWLEDEVYKDPDTEDLRDKRWLSEQMKKLEGTLTTDKTAHEFRQNLVKKVLAFKGKVENAHLPPWKAIDAQYWSIFEQNILPTKKEMLPVIGFEERKDAKEREKHEKFFERLCAQGYTKRQARRLVEWYIKNG